MRDEWLMAVVGAMILAANLRVSEKPTLRLPWFATTLAAIVAALTMPIGLCTMHIGNKQLKTQLEKNLPMQAVEAVQAKGYAGPLFNDYDWGGYLIWALHMPVSIDGRQNLYGDERINRSIKTWDGEPDWATDPQLKSAGVVIGAVRLPLIQLLRTDPHFQLVYEDKLAAVFVAHK
jgi:hypothetical protein